MCGCEATQRVSATILTVRRHGADDGVEILLLLQTSGVGLRGHCTERRRSNASKCHSFYTKAHFSVVTGAHSGSG